MLKLFARLRRMKYDSSYMILNHFVSHIPAWFIRKAFYKLYGMKIGKGARISISTKVVSPERIRIGERTVINEMCYLDGRGGIEIGNDCSISFGVTLITGSHLANDPDFKYYTKPICIEDHVWIGAHTSILDGSTVKRLSVVGACSVIKGVTEESGIYVGNPARMIKKRKCTGEYQIEYKPYFR